MEYFFFLIKMEFSELGIRSIIYYYLLTEE